MTQRLKLAVVLTLAVGLDSAATGQPSHPVPATATRSVAAKAKPRKLAMAGEIAATVTTLVSVDVDAAAKAAVQLGGSELPAAHDALLDALALGLPPPVAVSAIIALTAHPAPPDVASLKRYASHRAPTVRSAALAALAMYPDAVAHASVIGGLHDPVAAVRAAAATAAGKGRVREAVEPMFELLAKGEEASARALAQLADASLAAQVADHLGKVPDASLALCLGAILKRPDFGPDTARVEVVRAIAKIQDSSAMNALTDYIDSVPKNPPRPSRHEAELVVEARLGGK